MRKFLIPLLMASAMVPVVAEAQWRDADRGDRTERSEARSDNGDRGSQQRAQRRANSDNGGSQRSFERRERPQRTEQTPVFQAQPQQVQQQVRQQAPVSRDRDRSMADGFRGVIEERNRRDQANSTGGSPDVPVQVVRDRTSGDRNWDRNRDGRRDGDRRWGGTADAQRWATRDGSWSRAWRDDNRYDWRRHRERNRFVFRIGTYYDPYRYGYRRFSVGYNLWPSYYSSNFWLDDPWQYRLPPAWGPYRWVRYYDDALLVNIYTGQVVDVIYGVFW